MWFLWLCKLKPKKYVFFFLNLGYLLPRVKFQIFGSCTGNMLRSFGLSLVFGNFYYFIKPQTLIPFFFNHWKWKFWNFGLEFKWSFLSLPSYSNPRNFFFFFSCIFFFLGNKQSYWVLAFRTEHFRSCFLDSSGNLIFGSFLVLLVLLFLAGGAFYFFTVQFWLKKNRNNYYLI